MTRPAVRVVIRLYERESKDVAMILWADALGDMQRLKRTAIAALASTTTVDCVASHYSSAMARNDG